MPEWYHRLYQLTNFNYKRKRQKKTKKRKKDKKRQKKDKKKTKEIYTFEKQI